MNVITSNMIAEAKRRFSSFGLGRFLDVEGGRDVESLDEDACFNNFDFFNPAYTCVI